MMMVLDSLLPMTGLFYIKKGFMTFDTFWEALTKADERYHLDNLGVLLHFRIATHGGVIPAMDTSIPDCVR